MDTSVSRISIGKHIVERA